MLDVFKGMLAGMAITTIILMLIPILGRFIIWWWKLLRF